MDSISTMEKENEKSNKMELKNMYENIKSRYILKKIFNNIPKNKLLKIVKINKIIKQKLNIDINDYKYFTEIEIEITPIQNKFGNFININSKEDEKYYHIYFDNNKEEIKRTYLKKGDNVSKINIIIAHQVNSFNGLFYKCIFNKSIYFKRFNRRNIINMSYMFYGCSSLEELNLSNFNTNNVNDMSAMFKDCSSLKELNLSNFNTENVNVLNL